MQDVCHLILKYLLCGGYKEIKIPLWGILNNIKIILENEKFSMEYDSPPYQRSNMLPLEMVDTRNGVVIVASSSKDAYVSVKRDENKFIDHIISQIMKSKKSIFSFVSLNKQIYTNLKNSIVWDQFSCIIPAFSKIST